MIRPVLVEDFDYPLPSDLIAQHPSTERDASRLLVLNREPFLLSHRRFTELPDLLRPDDVLVLNDSKVVPARLRARKALTRGDIEILLAEEITRMDWWVMLRPAKRVRPGTSLEILDEHRHPSPLRALVMEKSEAGLCRLRFEGVDDLFQALEILGEVPLPPYIHRESFKRYPDDRERYQTVFADAPGSVAAPTAGLHFTEALLDQLRQCGFTICRITLHVGLGTFAPIKTARVEDHRLHTERFSMGDSVASALNEARSGGRRIVAVGTTTVRVLEHVTAAHDGRFVAGAGATSIFLYPPAQFRAVDALITNFHLPRSSLLMLVSALASPGSENGRDLILRAYAEAVQHRYRFFSYGDAMLIQ